jgi:DNA topoisomerase-3
MIDRLYIAEKPSVAKGMAKVLGANDRKSGYFINADTGEAVTWCVGHLLRTAYPKEINPIYSQWKLDLLPFIPETPIKLLPEESKKDQLNVLKKLIGDCNEVVIATDKEREGELIAVELLEAYNFKGKRLRALFSAVDPATLKKALSNENLVSAVETEGLYYAALARQAADYIVGLNITMALTAVNRDHLGQTATAGRVQTAVLALVAMREESILNHIAKDYYNLDAKISHDNKDIMAKWQHSENLKEILDHNNPHYNPDLAKESVAKLHKILSGTKAAFLKKRIVSQKETPQPVGYDLGGIQKEANKKFGYGIKNTLEIVQGLYEKGLVTYPRTDSAHLESGLWPTRERVLASVKRTMNNVEYNEAISGCDISIKTKTWDDSKVTDHHGIIPTETSGNFSTLSPEEKCLFDLIAKRFIIQFYGPYKYENTKYEFDITGEQFNCSGNVPRDLGWKKIYSAGDDDNDSDNKLPAMDEGSHYNIKEIKIKSDQTKKPARYTEASLLEDMENAHKFVNNDKLKKLLKDKGGIGRPATCASHIDNLFKRKYIEFENSKGKVKKIKITRVGTAIYEMAPQMLKDPATTAYWEQILDDISDNCTKQNQKPFDDFMAQQTSFVTRMMDEIKSGKCTLTYFITDHKCPSCGGPAVPKKGKFGKYFKCMNVEDCGFNLPDVNGRPGKPKKRVEQPETDIPCGICDGGHMIKYASKDKENEFYWMCSNMFDKSNACKTTATDDNGKPGSVKKGVEQPKVKIKCEVCKTGNMVKYADKKKEGEFYWMCSKMFDKKKACKTTASDNDGVPVYRKGKQ